MFLSPPALALRQDLHSGLLRALGLRPDEPLTAHIPPILGVAVSGGSDSMALLHLLHDLTKTGPTELRVATVDHGLRPESRSEAEHVAVQVGSLGLSHDILTWAEPATAGNLQDAARQARYDLLTKWAVERGVAAIAVGHTADDQAETVLMRLRRAAGVTGLSGMSTRSYRDGIELLRPLLGLRRAALRQDLQHRGVTWLDDPSNLNHQFERIRMRDALQALDPLGVTVEQLAVVAQNMQRAEAALAEQTAQAAAHLLYLAFGAVVIDYKGFMSKPEEVRRRLFLAALTWRLGPGYPPRRAAVEAVLEALEKGRGSTLAGCRILPRKGKIWIFREGQAVQNHAVTCPEPIVSGSQRVIWDRIWEVTVPPTQATGGGGLEPEPSARVEVRPVGDPAALGEEGHALLAAWRELDMPRELLMVSPALWRGAQFLGDLTVKPPAEWRCQMQPNEFICDLEALSH